MKAEYPPAGTGAHTPKAMCGLLHAGSVHESQHKSGQVACGLPIRPLGRIKTVAEEPGTADLLGLSDDENDSGVANRQPIGNSGTISQAAAGALAETESADDVDRSELFATCADGPACHDCPLLRTNGQLPHMHWQQMTLLHHVEIRQAASDHVSSVLPL